MTIGVRDASFSPIYLALVVLSAAVVDQKFVCPNEGLFKALDHCNSTVHCPVYAVDSWVTIEDWTSTVPTDCRVQLLSTGVVLLTANAIANVTSSAACSAWFTAGHLTSTSDFALRDSCATARYQAKQFVLSGDVVVTFASSVPSTYQNFPVLIYKQVVFRPLCTAVVSLNSSSYVAPPLDFAGGNCTSRLDTPPGTAVQIRLEDSQPRADGRRVSSDCVCYSDGAASTSRCLAVDKLTDVWSGVILTVKSDEAGPLCTAMIYVSVKAMSANNAQVGEASRPLSSQLLVMAVSATVLRLVFT